MSVKILCNVKRQNKLPGSFKAIEFIDKFCDKKIELFPTKLLLSPKALKEWLIDRHFELSPDEEWKDIIELLKQKSDKTGEIVDQIGFHGKNYLLPNGTIIGPQEDHTLFLDPEHPIHLPHYGVSGSLGDWKQYIAPAALHSSRIMLAIGNAFSGYLLFLVNIESGGFNLFGKSSIGKTTTEKIGISISGPRSNLQSWNFTKTGAEDLAYGHNDNHLALDELKTLDGDPTTAAQKASEFIYSISSGKGKSRSQKYESHQKIWRVVILSTGELSLANHAKNGHSRRMEGEEVRVIDVPADASKGLGIYESLPKEFTDASSYAEYLDQQSQQYYGTAQAAFLEQLIAEINEENAEQAVKDQLAEWMEKFRSKCSVDQESGVDVRFANRFAFACAAGCLAVKYGILPFTTKDVFKGISACYKAALAMKPESLEEQLIRHEEKLSEYLTSKEFPALDSKKSWSKQEIEKHDGFTHTINDIQLIVLKPNVVKNLIPEFYLKDVLNTYKLEGYLLPGADGSNTRSITLNGKKVRHYCFVWPRDKSNIAAAKKLMKSYL
ncbi:MAG: DUF927 domain-containing protein [Nitrosomonas sp.]|nr:MAG: DUF927 domain-containing protein [Nitrosomonas sp.]